MTFSINKIKSINLDALYKIGAYEIIILFTLLFFTYTMPITVYKFTSSLFGKLIALSSIVAVSYINIAYGIVLSILFIFISEIGYLQEGFVEKHVIPSVKDDFIKQHCSAEKKTKFNLETIEKDYKGIVYSDGVCDPCDKTCRYTINNTNENLYIFDNKIKPKDSTYVQIK